MKNILKYGIMAFTVGVAVTSCDAGLSRNRWG